MDWVVVCVVARSGRATVPQARDETVIWANAAKFVLGLFYKPHLHHPGLNCKRALCLGLN